MPVNIQLRYGPKRKQSPSKQANLSYTESSAKHHRHTSSEEDVVQSRDDVSQDIKRLKKGIKSPYRNKLKTTVAEVSKHDDPVSSQRSECKFETYLEQQLLAKANQHLQMTPQSQKQQKQRSISPERELQAQNEKLTQELFNANRYIQSQLQAKNEQEQLILNLRQQLSKQLESTPVKVAPSSRMKSPKGSPNSQSIPLAKLKEENEHLKTELIALSTSLSAKEHQIHQLQVEKQVCEDRIQTLQAEIETFWSSQSPNLTYESPVRSRQRSPEQELKSMQRHLAEQNEKLEITYEVNNILKLQLNKLMQQLREYETRLAQSPPKTLAEAELKSLQVTMQQMQVQFQQQEQDFVEREKLYLEQIRTMQNPSMHSHMSEVSELNLERAKKKIESQKRQKEELKQLLKESQDQLQETILQNQELRKIVNSNKKPTKPTAKEQHRDSVSTQQENRTRVASTQKSGGKRNSRASKPIEVVETPETREAKHMVGSMIKSVVTFKQKIKKIHQREEEKQQAGINLVELDLNALLGMFDDHSPPIKQSSTSEIQEIPMPKISNVNLTKMLIELQCLIKEIDPSDYANYQKEKAQKNASPNTNRSSEQQFLNHFSKAYNGIHQIDAMIPNLSTADNSESVLISQKQNEINSLKGDMSSIGSLLGKLNDANEKEKTHISGQLHNIVKRH